MNDKSRRDFLRSATTSIGLALSAPAIAALLASCETDETLSVPTGKRVTLDVSLFPELAAVGGIVSTAIVDLNDSNPVFVSRVADSAFVVFSTICTHQACQVGLPMGHGMHCICPCHGAMYSFTDGKVLRQPNTGSATDLPKFASEFNSGTNILTITA